MMQPNSARRPLWSNVSVLALMILVLLAAGTLSAVTAMRIAIRGTEVVVPDLRGTDESEAEELLEGQGLEIAVDGRRFNTNYEAGEILDQSPEPGARVKSDRRVRVRVSLGEREFPVPDVRGISLRATQLSLAQRRLTLGSTLYAHSPNQDAGTVLFQSPEPGATENDPSVNVLVSLGGVDQYFVMPVLTDLEISDARTRVRSSGFRLTEIEEVDPNALVGRVVSQQPLPGHRISSGDTVVLGVSR